jgi:hypothetical protein
MDLAALRARVLTANFFAHGVACTVTRPAPDDEPITTTAIWLTTTTEDAPVGEFSRREPRRVIALQKSDVPTCKRGTEITAPELGESRTWIVDGVDRSEADHWRAVVTLKRTGAE